MTGLHPAERSHLANRMAYLKVRLADRMAYFKESNGVL
jgi:hypothetical protein